MQFYFPGLQAVRHGAGLFQEVGELVALEADAFGVGGEEDAKGLEAGVFDLVLEVGEDFDLGFGDGGVLEAGDLNPRVHLFDRQDQAPGRLQDAEGQHALLADAGFLRVQLRDAITGGDLEAEALFGHDEECAALFARFAEDKLRNRPGLGRGGTRARRGFDAGAGEANGELLTAFGFAAQVQRDDADGLGLELGPMAQGRAADGLDIEAGRHDEAEAENASAGNLDGGVRGQNGAVFAQ